MERAEGGALDRAQERLGEGACPARLGVSEEGAYEPSGSQALKRPGSRIAGAGGFQKNLPERLKAIEKAHPGAEVELWAEDEARLGLKPVISGAYGHRWEGDLLLASREATNGPISTVLCGLRAERSTG